MLDYTLNETVFVAKENNPFGVPGEAFKAAFISINSETGKRMVILKNINLAPMNKNFKEESFAIEEERLSELFEVAEETVEELYSGIGNETNSIALGDLEKILFGRELSEDERFDVMNEMGVLLTTKDILDDKTSLIGHSFTPKKNFHSFEEGSIYKVKDVVIGEDLKTVVYLLQSGEKIFSFKTNVDFLDLFEQV